MRIFSDEVTATWPAERLLPRVCDRTPAIALDEAPHGIEARYGTRTAAVVAMQLEYPMVLRLCRNIMNRTLVGVAVRREG